MIQETDETPDFEGLCMPFKAGLFAFALRLCKGDRDWASDVLQDSFIRAWRFWSKWQPPADGSPRAWLFQIVSNTFVNDYHHQRSRPERLQQTSVQDSSQGGIKEQYDGGHMWPDNQATDAFQEIIDNQFTDEVEFALSRLSAVQRDIVIRHYVLEQSYRQIAEETGIDFGTVSSRLARARTELEPMLLRFARAEYGMGFLPKKRLNKPANNDQSLAVTVQ